ncbi:hypothetical protein imdm_1156 [gamma proteobacterium IMCC2047]|nr:hypothetical protein imdm_1156 [gamma proteobacterium IMCC2047]
MTNFEDIRPYNDDEVKPTIKRLLNDAGFIDTISAFKLAGKPQWLRNLLRPLVKQRLNKELGAINSVKDVQTLCEKYVHRVIETTTTKLSFSGLEKLSADRPYFFISNHRDIVMDPALVNFALYHHGLETPQLAIGDNLLQKPFVSDLMRLNKSFIVKRSAAGVREKLQAFTDLSSYIHHAHRNGHSTWIAQKEGRAKDGVDSTDPAIIKMLYMSQRKSGLSFSEYMNWLQIVPVSLSYEYNPCDLAISEELHQKRSTGSYQKAEGEDIRSITTGITGLKGDVHVAFGTPLAGNLDDAETVATKIDEQVMQEYRFHDSNHIAAELISTEAQKLRDHPLSKQKQAEFMARLDSCDEKMKDIFLAMYANPVLRRLANPPS